MTKQLWLNLPVKDIGKSKEFFTKLGFSFSERHGDSADSAALLVGEHDVVVMLFAEHLFERFSGNSVSDAAKGSEVLISIDAESREEVDALMQKAKDAGAHIYGEAGESQGWMYGGGFADLDGHRWNVLFMDMSKMPG